MRHVLARVRGAAIAAALVASLAVTGIEPTASFAASLDDPDSVSSGAASPDATRSASATSDDTSPAVEQAEADTPQASTVPLGGDDASDSAAPGSDVQGPATSDEIKDDGAEAAGIAALSDDVSGGISLLSMPVAGRPYLAFAVRDTAGNLVGGATVNIQGPRSGTNSTTADRWPAAVAVADCTVDPCSATSLDQDSTPGMFAVDRLTGGTNPAQLSTTSRYRLGASSSVPAGYASWTTGAATGLADNSANWVATIPAQGTTNATVNTAASGAWVNNGTNTVHTFATDLVLVPNAPYCTAGYIYAIGDTGQLQQISPSGVVSNVGSVPSGVTSPQFNGLGIGPGGATVYAFTRNSRNLGQGRVYSYDASAGTWSRTFSGTGWDMSASSLALVAGGVSPAGTYYAGGFDTSGGDFRLWSMNAAGTRMVSNGYLDLDSYDNGDITFDTEGNLYLVRGKFTGDNTLTTVFRVSRADLLAAAGTTGSIPYTAYMAQTSIVAGVNGASFDGTGSLYLGTASELYHISLPGTPLNTAPVTLSGTTLSSTDLASCSLPPVVKLQKTLPNGRVVAADQFTLEMRVGGTVSGSGNSATISGGTTLGTATASTPAAGVQNQAVGAFPVTQGRTITFREAFANGADAASYSSSYVCTIDGQPMQPVVSGAATAGSFVVPTSSGGAVILCTFTNIPILPAAVRISKTVQDLNGLNPQPGAGWTMGASLGSGSTSGTTISPAGTKQTGTNGSVATPWSITFPNGTATANVVISETQQTGYDFVSGTCTITPLSGSPTTVTLTSASGTVPGVTPGASVVCTFTNKQRPGTATWQKTDATSGSALGGSTWTLTGPGVPADTIVSDCTASPCSTGLYSDTDPAAGGFQLAGLAWGSYTIQEQSAPAGYQLSTTPRTFTISASSLAPTVTGSPFANTRIPGAVTWVKVADDAARTPLGGSEWKFVGPSPSIAELAVVDCVGQDQPNAAACAVDRDTRPGYFQVQNIAWGSYQLIETHAPAGYVLDAAPHQFTVSATTLQTSIGQIVNVQRQSPALPLTGGLGRDFFTILGLGVLGLGMALAIVLRIRARRREAD